MDTARAVNDRRDMPTRDTHDFLQMRLESAFRILPRTAKGRFGGAKRTFVVTPQNGGFLLSATQRPRIRKTFPERLSGASCSPCQGPASSTSPSSRLDFFAHESIAVGEARRGGLTVAAPALPGHGLSSVRAPDRPVSEPKEKVHGKACKEKPDRRRHRR